jgi:uncharacterized protein with HEPN domain
MLTRDVRLALLHLVQIVAEAAAGLSDELISAYPEVPWRLIIATRNRSYTATSTLISTCFGM